MTYQTNNIIVNKRISDCYSHGGTILDLSNLSFLNLTTLPDNLPTDLHTLDCYRNNLTTLPNNLPKNLHTLNCYGNNLTTLPNNLPKNLKVLYCSKNSLTTIPNNLPVNLHTLHCYGNNLTTLPNNLPNNLKVLNCSRNNLTTIPNNLPTNLHTLYCSENNLTILPIELFHIKDRIIYGNNTDHVLRLFQKNAYHRIMKWYNIRKTINRTLVAKKLYDNTLLPKDICILIGGMT